MRNRQITALAILTYATLVVAQDRSVRPGYSVSNFALELDGAMAGFLNSAEGGTVSAPVIEEVAGQDIINRKHIGQPIYDAIEIQLGLSSSPAVNDWIQSSWGKNYKRKNGAIVIADQNMEIKHRREFFEALLTETTFPACDGSSKDPGRLSIKISPEYTRLTRTSGPLAGEKRKQTQKQWHPSDFRLTIDGLDCSKVIKLESLTVKRPATLANVGDNRDPFKEPGKVDYPNLKITLAASSIESWQTWYESFLLAGNNGQESEKTGTLEYLSADRQKTLLKLEFQNLGIFSMVDDKLEGDRDAPATFTIELYCESISIIPESGEIK